MLTYKQFITELMDKPYDWKYISDSMGEFTTENGNTYRMKIFVEDVTSGDFVDTMAFKFSSKKDEAKINDFLSKQAKSSSAKRNSDGELILTAGELSFVAKGEIADITGTGDQYRVFSTVVDYAKTEIKRNSKKWDVLRFTAKEPSRKKLYRTLTASLAKKYSLDWIEIKKPVTAYLLFLS